ncbi:uncharacterized protein [Eleutherodactylus coqui]|uniref:uncharacterized protein n=1 Tax=Eleutherodactylus coqui TaxID=57060 RepID=UPI003461D7E0
MHKDEWLAVKNLSKNQSVIIKPADKGGAVVVMDRFKYLNEIRRQLNDVSTYEKLRQDPTLRFQMQLRVLINEAINQAIIDQQLADYLLIEYPITPTIYVLPKIHKDLANPPGRPIISGRESLFSNISRFLDRVLRPFAIRGLSYIRDTSDFLNKIKEVRVSEHSLLVSLDVVSLYTIIAHDKGLDAVRDSLLSSDWNNGTIQFILTLLEFILTNNYFIFENAFYRQCCGTAMGSNVAPTYAVIFMNYVETTWIYTSPSWQYVRGWWRYIDDVFLIWEGTEMELTSFFDELNNILPELRFTMSTSTTELQFLDVLVIKKEGHLETDLFTKVTDRNNLLVFDSFHPRKTIESLPWSQLLRVRRIVSNEKVNDRLEQMYSKFRTRGYPANVIGPLMEKARQFPRDQLLSPKHRDTEVSRIPFVSTYSPASDQIMRIIRRHWLLLSKGCGNVPEFRSFPIMAYRRGRNLKDRLVRSYLSDIGPPKQRVLYPVKTGNFPCLSCTCCSNMSRGNTFNHPRTGKKFYIRQRYTCKSSYVVYLISCHLVC